jgi:FHA domain
MGDTIQVEVVDRLTGARRVESCRLPLEIGKKPDAASHILLDAKYSTISRIHGRLEQRGAVLVYVDCSSNGTTIAGELLKGRDRELNGGETLQIENYDLRILDVVLLQVKHTSPNLLPRQELSLEPGKSVLVRNVDGTLALTEDPGEADGAAARLSYDGVSIVLELFEAELTQAVTVNNGPVRGARVEARPFDVIAIKGDRLELLQPNHEKIVCGNPECHLLNNLPFEENCTWCGYYLAASGSFTRVTLP